MMEKERNTKPNKIPEAPRITVTEIGGCKVYCAGAWPGWKVLRDTFIVWIFIALFVAILLIIIHQYSNFIHTFLDDWIGTGLSFIIGGVIDWSLLGIFGFVLIMMPFLLIFELSAKQIWIDNGVLYRKTIFLGIQRTVKIPFRRILDLIVGPSAGCYVVNVRYEMKLPKWLIVILAYWNERFTQWGTTLIDAIPTQAEADWFYAQLVEPMTLVQSKP